MTASLDQHVIGHSTVLRVLEKQFEQQPQELKVLLVGEEHLGKFTIAQQFLKSVHCAEHVLFQPCNACADCRAVDQRIHPDHRMFDGEHERITVDDVRSLRGFFHQTALGYRTILLNRPESLTTSASNALLKVLEEPPRRTILALVTNHLEAVLPTIRSRMQLLYLYRVPHEELHRAFPTATQDALSYAAGRPGLLFTGSDDPNDAFAWTSLFSRNYLERRNALVELFPARLSFAEKKLMARQLVTSTERVLRAILCEHLKLPQHRQTRVAASICKELSNILSERECQQLLNRASAILRFLDLNIQPELACEHLYLSSNA